MLKKCSLSRLFAGARPVMVFIGIAMLAVALCGRAYGEYNGGSAPDPSGTGSSAATQTQATGQGYQQMGAQYSGYGKEAAQEKQPGLAEMLLKLANLFTSTGNSMVQAANASRPYFSTEGYLRNNDPISALAPSAGSLLTPRDFGGPTVISPVKVSSGPPSDNNGASAAISPRFEPDYAAAGSPTPAPDSSAPPPQALSDSNALMAPQAFVDNPSYDYNLNPTYAQAPAVSARGSVFFYTPVPAEHDFLDAAENESTTLGTIYASERSMPASETPIEPVSENIRLTSAAAGNTSSHEPARTKAENRHPRQAPRASTNSEYSSLPYTPQFELQDNNIGKSIGVANQNLPQELVNSLQVEESAVRDYLIRLLGSATDISVTKTAFEDSQGERIAVYYVSVNNARDTGLIIYESNGRILGIKFVDGIEHITGIPVYTPEPGEFYEVADTIQSSLAYQEIKNGGSTQEPPLAAESVENAVSIEPTAAIEATEKKPVLMPEKAPVSAIKTAVMPQPQYAPDKPALKNTVESIPTLPQEGRILFEHIPVLNRSVWLF